MNTNYSRYELQIAIMTVVISLVVPIGMDGYVPSLPAMTREFGSTANTMQLTITLYLLGGVISQLFCGSLSDRFGRRKLVLTGMSISLVGAIICVLAGSPKWLIFGRFVQGLGLGANNALFRAILRDTFSGTRMAKIASHVGLLYVSAVALAPIIGGYVQTYFDWRGNFVFFILIAIITISLAVRFLPETNQQLNQHATRLKIILQNYITLFSSRIFLGNVLCSSLALSGIIAYFAVSPFLLQNVIDLSAAQYGWSTMILAVGLMLGSFLNGSLVTSVGTYRMILLGLILMTCSGALMLFLALSGFINLYAIILPALLFSTAGGFVYANAMSGAFHPFAHMAGTAGAAYSALQILGAFITSFCAANLHVHNQIPLATLFSLLGIVGMIVFWVLLRGEK